MDDKKKKYVIPEAELVDFVNEDIITKSVEYDPLNPEADWDGGVQDTY